MAVARSLPHDVASMESTSRRPRLAWLNISFLAATHVAAIAGGIAYFALRGPPSWTIWALAFVWAALTIFGISAGYHRLFSHRAYEAHPALRAFLLLFGAATFENSALNWSADHRRHHRRVDTDEDPYNARRGFWWSHIGWILFDNGPGPANWAVPDLERDRLVQLQHRYYPWIGAFMSFVLPALIGLALGDWVGALVFAGVVRLVVVHHITFSINSFAHILGTQPYSDRDSSRDSFVCALLSMGEGYHNYHHTFPVDYRNGVRAHQFDPTKWTLSAFSKIGLAKNLRRTPAAAILQARLRMDAQRLERCALPHPLRERLAALQLQLDAKLAAWRASIAKLETARAEMSASSHQRLEKEMRALRRSVRRMHREWKDLVAHAATYAQPHGQLVPVRASRGRISD